MQLAHGENKIVELKSMIYTLKNDNIILEINSFGAELKSVKYQNTQYLHEGDEKYWKRSSPVLFPIVGKLKDNTYFYDNSTYNLPQHGFARDNEFNLENKTDNSISFVLIHNNETLKSYPFKFRFEITYILNENDFEIIYKISSSQDIYFSFGAHPAFKLHASLEDSFVNFEKKEQADLYCLDKNTGCIEGKKENFLDSNILKLNQDSFKNDALIFKDLNSQKVSLKNTKNNKQVSIEFQNFKNLGLWAPTGADFICIEPWCGIADDINTTQEFKKKKDIEFLRKNEEFKSSIQISFDN